MNQETQQNQEVTPESDVIGVVMMPHIEENIPLPKNAKDAMPDLNITDELNLRVETIKTLADIKGDPIDPDSQDIKDAENLAREILSNPMMKPEFDKYGNETLAYLAGLVAQTNTMIVKDLADFKLYVVNNLVKVAESTDNAKEKIMALRAIGEVDGVDAFKKKTEVTHKVESMEEVEKELLTMLNDFKAKGLIKKPEVIDAEEIEDDDDTDGE